MARPVIDRTAANAARQFAREDLAMRAPKLRRANGTERAKALKTDPNNAERVSDVVVATDKNGAEALLYIDVDPSESRHLKRESALMTTMGLVPLVGKPTVLFFAFRDILVAGVRIIRDKMAIGASKPKDRAILHMGLKHLGLTTASYATGGIAHGIVVAGECAVVGHDLKNGHKDGHALKAAGAALKGLIAVHEHESHHDNPPSITVVEANALVVNLPKAEAKAEAEADGTAKSQRATELHQQISARQPGDGPAMPPGRRPPPAVQQPPKD